jgi:hypothetical protein
MKAEAKGVKTGDAPDYSRCDDKFSDKWQLAESQGAGMCPSNGDEAEVQSFIVLHADDLATALAGGTPPNCPADLATCNSTLATCDSSLTGCNASLGACSADLTSCTSDLGTCSTDLGTCNADLGTCNTSLGSCNTTLASTQASLTTCTADLTTCDADLSTCDADLTSCEGELATCEAEGFPATGVTAIYLADKNDGVPGPVSVPDDGTLQRGETLDFLDNGDGTITDLNTGLMWEKKGDNGGLHDKDNVYRWTGNGAQETIWDWLDDVNAEGGSGFAG